MLFLGAFIIRYRIELILGFPLVAFTMAIYLKARLQARQRRPEPRKALSRTSPHGLLRVNCPRHGPPPLHPHPTPRDVLHPHATLRHAASTSARAGQIHSARLRAAAA
ncbi:hypothetical protein [Tunturiibacter empetritectus]|uniref:hypothetical protein n=1 Tax=Tunturiibacter empetritectus TaxID=3069691 RepID=UPI003D9BF7DA